MAQYKESWQILGAAIRVQSIALPHANSWNQGGGQGAESGQQKSRPFQKVRQIVTDSQVTIKTPVGNKAAKSIDKKMKIQGGWI